MEIRKSETGKEGKNEIESNRTESIIRKEEEEEEGGFEVKRDACVRACVHK